MALPSAFACAPAASRVERFRRLFQRPEPFRSFNKPRPLWTGFLRLRLSESYRAVALAGDEELTSGFSHEKAAASRPAGDQRSTTTLASFPMVCSASLSPVHRSSELSQVNAEITIGPALVEMSATSLRTLFSAPVLLPIAEP